MQAIYLLKIQAIRSKGQQARLYVYFPLPLAAAIGLQAGEEVQWELLDRAEILGLGVLTTLNFDSRHNGGQPLRRREEFGTIQREFAFQVTSVSCHVFDPHAKPARIDINL
jgi:hypothetical protein